MSYNPNAFPLVIGERMFEEGMSLRDWFAGQAINAIYSRLISNEGDEGPMDANARDAYRIADAMLAAREHKA